MSMCGGGEVEGELLCAVIVPVYNGEATIGRCLDALACQSVPPDRYEVIVVDDGSHDGTAARVDAWAAAHPAVSLRLVRQANKGPAAARNHGAQVARAPLLLFTDADCAPLPRWMRALVTALKRPEVVGAKGVYVTDQQGLVPRFVQAEYEDRYDRMRGSDRIDFVDTYSAAYRRPVFEENGGFDTTFTTASVEDQELSFRLSRKGYRLVFVSDAQVSHLHDSDVWAYWRRKYAIGYWKALVARWHPERMVHDSHTPQVLKVQMALWMGILALTPLALAGLLWPPLAWVWPAMGLLLVLFLFTALPFVTRLARRSWQLAAVGPFMLAVRALALGIGFLAGTVHFLGMPPGRPQADGSRPQTSV